MNCFHRNVLLKGVRLCVLPQITLDGRRTVFNGYKRFVKPTLRIFFNRLENIKEKETVKGIVKHHDRTQFIEWNYDVELFAFQRRLGEQFEKPLLEQAFCQRDYVNVEETSAAVSPQYENVPYVRPPDNLEMINPGAQLIIDTIVHHHYDTYPDDVITSIVTYLTSDEMLSYVGRNLGIAILIRSVEFPPSDQTVANTVKAVIRALDLSSGSRDRTESFIRDFIISQLVEKDIYDDIFHPSDPVQYLKETVLKHDRIESRICRQSAINTILANYQVGWYDDNRQLLGLGWGEDLDVAQRSAAIDAITRIYSRFKRQ